MKTRKSILIIAHPHFTIPGGAGKVILELSKRLAVKYRIIIIAQQIRENYLTDYPQLQFINIGGPLTDSFRFWLLFHYWQNKYYKIISKYSQNNSIDIIVNSFPSNWLLLGLSKRFPKNRFYWYCHEPSAFIHDRAWQKAIKNPLKRLIAYILKPLLVYIDRKLVCNAKLIFANSIYTKNNVLKIYDRNSSVIYPSIDFTLYKPAKAEMKKNYIITAARITKYKRIDILIKAMVLLKNKDILIYIVGDGEHKSKLQKLAHILNINQRIKFYPAQHSDRLVKLISEAKIFISCSHNETFGLVLLEALACGTPVISQISGGPKEIVEHNKNGLLINCTPKLLAQTIDNLLSNQQKIEKLANDSRSSVIKKFNWDRSVQKIIKEIA